MAQKKVKLRHNRILNELKRNGNVDLKELADKFGYHEMTIRRDLKRLEDEGYLVRTLGGACVVPARFLGYSPPVDQQLNWKSKQEIVEHISKNMIEENDTIFLTSGVTMLQLLKQLHVDHEHLHIYTNSVDNISFEYANFKFQVTVVGGHLRPDSPCFYGNITKNGLELLEGKMDKVFMEVDAVVAEDEYEGFMQYNNFESSLYKQVLKLSKPENIYLVADKSKFKKIGVFEVAQFEDINCVITNKLKESIIKKYSKPEKIIQVE